MNTNAKKRSLLLATLGIILLMNVIACKKKDDPAVDSAGGTVATQRSTLTMQGAGQ